jgi:hypothetical protein
MLRRQGMRGKRLIPGLRHFTIQPSPSQGVTSSTGIPNLYLPFSHSFLLASFPKKVSGVYG